MSVGSDINIGRAYELDHFPRADETVVEDHPGLHSHFLGQGLQVCPILLALTTENMGVGGARRHVDNIFVLRQNVRQCPNDVFDSLVRREQAEGEEYRFPFHAKAFLIEIGIQKWQVGNAMRNQVDLAAGYFEYLLQELGRQLAHHDQAVRQGHDLLHDPPLVRTGFAKDGVESGDERHAETAEKGQNVTARRATKNSILMLQAHQIEIAEIQELGGL